MFSKIRSFIHFCKLNKQLGAGMVEYAMLLALILLTCLAAVQYMAGNFSRRYVDAGLNAALS